MNDTNEDNSFLILQKKANAFHVLGKVVHISLHNDRWKRGTITEVSSDFIMLEERLEGLVPVFFLEIKEIDAYRGERDGSGK